MLLTEKEARRVVCPYITYMRNESDVVGHREVTPLYEHSNCMGSGCAGWRWNNDPSVKNDIHKERLGYCGPAGRPVCSDGPSALPGG